MRPLTALAAVVLLGCSGSSTPPASPDTEATSTDTGTATGAEDPSTLECLGGLFSFGDDVPYADLQNALGSTAALVVRGRIIEVGDDFDPAAIAPCQAISQSEIDNAAVTVQLTDAAGAAVDLGGAQADEEGYLEASFDLTTHTLAPGAYTVTVSVDGAAAGAAHARLLAADDTEIAVRSDVDLTYLDTAFQSDKEKLDLLKNVAANRKTLPAMAAVYGALRSGGGAADRSLVFLSGSPRFFKQVLDAKMALDSVFADGLVLKPYKDIASANLVKPLDVVPALKEQVGYKLAALLRRRVEIPASVPELLMGDDSEADVVVYNLYHRFTSAQLDQPALIAELVALDVSDELLDEVKALAQPALDHLAGAAPVVAIYINRTGVDSPHAHPVAEWHVDDLVRHHTGAWPLILSAWQEGWAAKDAVSKVRTELLKTQTHATLQAAADQAVADGFLTQATLDEL